MSSLAAWQRRFIGAMHTPDTGLQTASSERGLDVYRNNIWKSLGDALSLAYPHTMTLIGERYFTAMARRYARQSPPADPIITLYGQDFPDFLDTQPGLAQYRYVTDIARLERARLEASHAPDGMTLTTEHLQQCLQGEALYIRPHPTCRLVTSLFGIAELWASLERGEPPAKVAPEPGNWLVTRMNQRISLQPLSPLGYRILSEMKHRPDLPQVIDELAVTWPQQDIARELGRLLSLHSLGVEGE